MSSAYYSIPNGYTVIAPTRGALAFSFDAYTVQAGDYSNSGHDTLNLTVDGTVATGAVSIPEPRSVTLLGLGIIAAGFAGKLRRRSR